MIQRPERGYTHSSQPIPQPAPLQVVFPPFPPLGTSQAYNQAVDEQRFINKNTVVNVDLVPIHAPPYTGKELVLFNRAVVGVPAADTEATNGAAAVATAISRFETFTVIVPTATTTWNNVLTYTVNPGVRAVFKGAGVFAHDTYATEFSAVLWRIAVNGVNILPDREAVGAFSTPDNLLAIHLVLSVGNIITIDVQNLDARSGAYVEARLNGWEVMVAQQDDSLQSMIPNQTMDTNGRYSVGGYCPPQPGT